MKVGSLVKCIATLPYSVFIGGIGYVQLPQRNIEYVIRGIIEMDHFSGEQTIVLEEITNYMVCQGCKRRVEFGFPFEWFRELQSPDEVSVLLEEILSTPVVQPGNSDLVGS